MGQAERIEVSAIKLGISHHAELCSGWRDGAPSTIK